MSFIIRIIIFAFLEQYKKKGKFILHREEKLDVVCNAPQNCPGVYIVYAVKGKYKKWVYIGCSGIEKNGKIQVRQDGLWDRLVNGQQRIGNKKLRRRKLWPSKIVEQGLDYLLIEWWNAENDFPEVVEFVL